MGRKNETAAAEIDAEAETRIGPGRVSADHDKGKPDSSAFTGGEFVGTEGKFRQRKRLRHLLPRRQIEDLPPQFPRSSGLFRIISPPFLPEQQPDVDMFPFRCVIDRD